MEELIQKIREHISADMDRKLFLRAEIQQALRDMTNRQKIRLINQLDSRELEIIIPCGLRGEVYAKAIKRLFDLRKSKKS